MSCLTSALAFSIGVIIAYLVQQHVSTISQNSKALVPRPHYKLAVGVLSAREHFEQRQAIRETWASPFRDGNSTRIWFVLGDRGCDVHPDYRQDPYSCTRWSPSIPDDFENAEALDFHQLSPPSSNKLLDYKQFRHEFHFKVLHPIVIKRLGLLLTVPLKETKAYVSVYDKVAENVFVKTSFSAKDPGIASIHMRYQTVEAFLLPKGFEGCVFVNFTKEDSSIFPVDLAFRTTISNVSGLLHIQDQSKGQLVFDEDKTTIHLISFVVAVQDKQQFIQLVNQQAAFHRNWISQQDIIRERLEEEHQKHRDVVFVNVTDVYRNLPRKLLLFHKWVFSAVAADFVMKTDDDCFVNLEKILSATDSKQKEHHKVWWGSFRDQWLVEHHGKWAESTYRADIYPTFACGSGNVVSRYLHGWIANNSQFLHSYQGEDVSAGIWLAAVAPTYVQDDQWMCSKGCMSSMYVSPELSTPEIRQMWTSYRQCSNPCGCDY